MRSSGSKNCNISIIGLENVMLGTWKRSLIKMEIDYSDIDDGIKDLVRTLNDIPFVETINSCEGHLRTVFPYEQIYPDKGDIFLTQGCMLFTIDEEHSKAQDLIDDLNSLADKYAFTKFNPNNPEEDEEKNFFFYMDGHDLRTYEERPDRGVVENHMRSLYQVPKEAGEKRKQEYDAVWDEFLEIAKDYTTQVLR